MRALRAAATALLTALLVVPGGPADATTPFPGQVLHVSLSATATTTDVPHLRPGLVRVEQRNLGPGQHDVALVRLHEGVTADDLLHAFETDYASAYGLIDAYGELDGTPAGGTGGYTVRLDPGRYLVLDTGSTDTVDANFLVGLYAPLDVSGPPAPGTPPHADAVAQVHDDRYVLPATLPRHGVLRVSDTGRHLHMVELLRLHDGVTPEQAVQTMLSGQGEWPGDPVPGAGVLSPGVTAWVALDLTPGTYLVYDVAPDPTGAPYLVDGVVGSVRVD